MFAAVVIVVVQRLDVGQAFGVIVNGSGCYWLVTGA